MLWKPTSSHRMAASISIRYRSSGDIAVPVTGSSSRSPRVISPSFMSASKSSSRDFSKHCLVLLVRGDNSSGNELGGLRKQKTQALQHFRSVRRNLCPKFGLVSAEPRGGGRPQTAV